MTDGIIKPPKIYSEWVELLDMFQAKTDDEAVITAMQNGTVEWQTGVAERFTQKLIDTVNARLNTASDKFQRDLNNARSHEGQIIQALLALRKEFCLLAKAINLPALPEKDRKQYVQLVLTQANKSQESLEESAKKDRTGKLASIIRNHKVNSF